MYCGFLVDSKYYKAYCVAHLFLLGNFTQVDDNICPQMASISDAVKFNDTCLDALINYNFMGSYNFQEITPRYYSYLKENNKLYEKGSNEFTARETFTGITPTVLTSTVVSTGTYDMTKTIFETLSSIKTATSFSEKAVNTTIPTTITIPVFSTSTQANGMVVTATSTTVKVTQWPITTTIKVPVTSTYMDYTTREASTEVVKTSHVYTSQFSYTKTIPFNAYNLQTDI
ncbi:hypothetical protein HDU92_004686 [Lobulomyces angularis]|nr:hypothetical protein HDU92_004686 [Lobulomyces angularis]